MVHLSDEQDSPQTPRKICNAPLSRRASIDHYGLQYHHIQLAPKLSRLDMNRTYLDRIMELYTHIQTTTTGRSVYTACPRIVADRFALVETWKFENDSCPRLPQAVETIIQPCPHQKLTNVGGRPLYMLRPNARNICTLDELQKVSKMAWESPGQEIRSHY